MLLSPDGILKILSAFANILTAASFMNIGTENTKKYSAHPVVKILFLYSFAYSVIPDKVAVLIAVGLFFTLEIQNFVVDGVDGVKEIIEDIDEKIN